MIVGFYILKNKPENIYEQPEILIKNIQDKKCIRNQVYLPNEYIVPTQIHYDLATSNMNMDLYEDTV